MLFLRIHHFCSSSWSQNLLTVQSLSVFAKHIFLLEMSWNLEKAWVIAFRWWLNSKNILFGNFQQSNRKSSICRDRLPTDETQNYERVHNSIPLGIFVSSPLSTCTSLLLSITTSSNKLRFGRVKRLRNGEEILYHVKSEFIRLELVCLGVSLIKPSEV